MSQEVKINVCEVIGTSICVASQDGQKVYAKIKDALAEGHKVNLSFANTEPAIGAFLDTAIGQLYANFTDEHINSYLKVVDIDPNQLEYLEDIKVEAKEYYQDPERFDHAWRELMGDDDDVIKDLGDNNE